MVDDNDSEKRLEQISNELKDIGHVAVHRNNLPMLYSDIHPVNYEDHKNYKINSHSDYSNLKAEHAIPVTVGEFSLVQRHYPIVFASPGRPFPLALFGLHKGVNTMVDRLGRWRDCEAYVPAYVRRYPFILAKLQPELDDLSLCFDRSSPVINPVQGQPLFAGPKPTEALKQVLDFCTEFEAEGIRTEKFVSFLEQSGLLMDGEVAITPEGAEDPFVYRGFKMVDEDKLRALSGARLRKMVQDGSLPLIYFHLTSLNLIRKLFSRHRKQKNHPVDLAR